MGGPHSLHGPFGEEKKNFLSTPRIEPRIIQPETSRCTDRVTWNENPN